MIAKSDVTAILAAGTFAGAQLMIGISFGAQWRQMSGPELVAAFTGNWFNIAKTIIPFALLQTIFLPFSLYLAWGNAPARKLWAFSLAIWLINCLITSAYHFPIVWASMQVGYSAAEIAAVVDTWVLVHWVRIALGYLIFVRCSRDAARARD
ncbi:MAG: hypothetical protein V7676_00095 [Parasphingorhabdus sp.]|uniref:hypothetical protein n=1 Tax=Parasphingorhabdus sp. TaxID=2709688 RepID=UPI00300300DE